jgi:hypothetical protein
MTDLNTSAGAVGWENAPSHYQGQGGIENFDVWDAYQMDPYTANAFKYLARWDKKGSPVNDLKKALHYIEEIIKRWNDPEAQMNWLNWNPAKPGRLTPANVVHAFGLTGNVGTATIHLLYFRSDKRPAEDLHAAKRYVHRAIREVEGV